MHMGHVYLAHHRHSIGLRSGELGGQIDILNWLLCSLNHCCFVAGSIILLKEATGLVLQVLTTDRFSFLILSA